MAAPGEALTPSGYITHHLTNLAVGNGGFWTVHLDSLFFSVLTGLAFYGYSAKQRSKQHQVCQVSYSVWLRLWLSLLILISKRLSMVATH